MSLFAPEPIRLDMPDAEVSYFPAFFEEKEANELFLILQTNIEWRADKIQIFGKWVLQPRLTAWYGDPGAAYAYSGIRMEPLAWTVELARIKEKIEATTGAKYNSVLLNYYRQGQDSMGWHADDERELGLNPVIASISLGAARIFHFKHRTNPDLKAKLVLEHGSLLLMAGATQHHWLHQVPKTAQVIGGRINLTFRWINL